MQDENYIDIPNSASVCSLNDNSDYNLNRIVGSRGDIWKDFQYLLSWSRLLNKENISDIAR